MTKGTLLFAQSGGPTAVFNSSAAGVIEEAQKQTAIERVLAARFGMDGILAENFFDATEMTPSQIETLARTPASAFGSCRFKLPACEKDESLYVKLKDIFTRHGVEIFIYNGGNDSMDTCRKIADYFAETDFPCRVVGVPKTVDNDLAETDHCPGYGSAAKYIATTIKEISLDTAVYSKGRITVCEIMGRDAGWLTAASSLSVPGAADSPDLIYIPELPFDKEKFFDDAISVYNKKKRCLVAVSEGIRDNKGRYVGAPSGSKDSFNHIQLGGVAAYLADVITTKFGIKTRAVELSLAQRAAGHLVSATDAAEARLAGRHAVRLAVQGETGKMVNYIRMSDNPYTIEMSSVDLKKVANVVRNFPLSYVNEDGTHIKSSFTDYLLPLIKGEANLPYENGLPSYFKLND